MDISIKLGILLLGNNKITVKELNKSKSRKTLFNWLKRIA